MINTTLTRCLFILIMNKVLFLIKIDESSTSNASSTERLMQFDFLTLKLTWYRYNHTSATWIIHLIF